MFGPIARQTDVWREIRELKKQIAQLRTATPSNAVVTAVNRGYASAFAVTASSTIIASTSLTVPVGFSRCAVTAIGFVTAQNDGAVNGLCVYTQIGPTDPFLDPMIAITGTNVPAGGSTGQFGAAGHASVSQLTGLTAGSAINVYVRAYWVSAGQPSEDVNSAQIVATGLFTR